MINLKTNNQKNNIKINHKKSYKRLIVTEKLTRPASAGNKIKVLPFIKRNNSNNVFKFNNREEY